ncbi:hypothetical protein HAX54_021358 [Datura stramonium]|uniref:Uncharacterized protein n=1 Tax=Datura stramonium TaxID=4076 RepID=A0ABS8S3C5_DATST|nr:hypothetical protein [Datura stramonium]
MVGARLSLYRNGRGDVLSFHTIFLLFSSSASSSVVSSSCGGGATDNSFSLLNQIANACLGFFSVFLVRLWLLLVVVDIQVDDPDYALPKPVPAHPTFSPHIVLRTSSRQCKPPNWMEDYIAKPPIGWKTT